MAITVEHTPLDFMPVYNPIEFSFSSDNVAEPAFQYLADVYVDAVKIARFRLDPEPDFDAGLVDISEVLRSQIQSVLCSLTSDKGIFDVKDSTVEYELKIGEAYEVAGVPTEFPDLAVETGIAYFGALKGRDFVDYSKNPSAPQVDSIFSTNAPRIQNIDIGEFGCLQLLTESSTTVTKLVIEVFTGGLSVIHEVTTAIVNTNAYAFASSPGLINLIDPSNFVVPPVQPIITSTNTKYTVEVVLSTGTTEKFTFNISPNCTKYDGVRLWWLNREGGFDSFTFELVSRSSVQIQRKSMKRTPKRLKADLSVEYSKADRTNVNYCNISRDFMLINSNWLTQEESAWLEELADSSEIYWEDDGELISVHEISDAGYEVRKRQNEQIFNQQFTLKFSEDNVRQEG